MMKIFSRSESSSFGENSTKVKGKKIIYSMLLSFYLTFFWWTVSGQSLGTCTHTHVCVCVTLSMYLFSFKVWEEENHYHPLWRPCLTSGIKVDHSNTLMSKRQEPQFKPVYATMKRSWNALAPLAGESESRDASGLARSRRSHNVVKTWSPSSIFYHLFLSEPAFIRCPPEDPCLLSHSGEKRTTLLKELVTSPGTSLVQVSISEPTPVARELEQAASPGLSQASVLQAQSGVRPPAHVAWGWGGMVPQSKTQVLPWAGGLDVVWPNLQISTAFIDSSGRLKNLFSLVWSHSP